MKKKKTFLVICEDCQSYMIGGDVDREKFLVLRLELTYSCKVQGSWHNLQFEIRVNILHTRWWWNYYYIIKSIPLLRSKEVNINFKVDVALKEKKTCNQIKIRRLFNCGGQRRNLTNYNKLRISWEKIIKIHNFFVDPIMW